MDEVAAAIADPVRRAILVMLRGQRLAAGEIADRFAISRPAISRHLRVLRESGLVRDTLTGRHRLYELDASRFAGLIEWLGQFTPAAGWERPAARWETPAAGRETPAARWETPAARWETPAARWETPAARWETPAARWETPAAGPETPAAGWESRLDALETEVYRTRRERRRGAPADQGRENTA